MPSTNGHGPKRAILYARVSDAERAKKGYSLRGQLDDLREFASAEEYEVLDEVIDPGEKRWTLDRPGIDRIRELVATNNVDVVLAWRWDRFGESPWPEVLALELEEFGCRLRSLDDSGEGEDAELLNGLKSLIAKRERRRITERSRMGKLRKAREGKVIARRMAKYGIARYGYRFNEARDGLVVDEARMAVVRRVFRMVGAEGEPIYAVKRTLEARSVPTATGGERWPASVIREYILDDIYKPHTYEEIKKKVTPAVAAHLDPDKRYGIWWWGRRRYDRKRVAEQGPNGRVYRDRSTATFKPEKEWIAVPVPDSGIPREWVDAARRAIKDNRRASNAGRRFWQLSGGILKCAECDWNMLAHTTSEKRNNVYYYYVCRAKYKKGPEFCTASKTHNAEELEARVWAEVRAYLEDPEQLRADLDRMIELERETSRTNPEQEMKLWADKLAEADAKRTRFQHAYAEGVIELDDLRARLAEIEEMREIAERELENLRGRLARVQGLERDRDAMLEDLAALAPEALDSLEPEERHRFYKMLRLKVKVAPDRSLEIDGAFPEPLRSGPAFCTPVGSHL